jgi:hypothetical protein
VLQRQSLHCFAELRGAKVVGRGVDEVAGLVQRLAGQAHVFEVRTGRRHERGQIGYRLAQ